MKIRKGDTVKVIAGKDKGKTGSVLLTLKDTDQVVIEGINVAKRHQKNRRTRSQGQIIEKSMPIHVSNVSLMEGDKAKKVRVARPSGKKI